MTRNTCSFQIKRGNKLSINFKREGDWKRKENFWTHSRGGRVIGRGKEKCPLIVKEKKVGKINKKCNAWWFCLLLEVEFGSLVICWNHAMWLGNLNARWIGLWSSSKVSIVLDMHCLGGAFDNVWSSCEPYSIVHLWNSWVSFYSSS